MSPDWKGHKYPLHVLCEAFNKRSPDESQNQGYKNFATTQILGHLSNDDRGRVCQNCKYHDLQGRDSYAIGRGHISHIVKMQYF